MLDIFLVARELGVEYRNGKCRNTKYKILILWGLGSKGNSHLAYAMHQMCPFLPHCHMNEEFWGDMRDKVCQIN
jgi:hypothetical protein